MDQVAEDKLGPQPVALPVPTDVHVAVSPQWTGEGGFLSCFHCHWHAIARVHP